MKAIMISVRPQWVAKILNGEKTIEIRKKFSKDFVGWVYIYVTRNKPYLYHERTNIGSYDFYELTSDGVQDLPNYKHAYTVGHDLNGKVVARFWCDKVEEILPFEEYESPFGMAYKLTKDKIVCCQKAQLTYDEYNHYLKGKKGCAIHISDLEIFDKPKEISEFKPHCGYPTNHRLTRAPQSWCYVEIEE